MPLRSHTVCAIKSLPDEKVTFTGNFFSLLCATNQHTQQALPEMP